MFYIYLLTNSHKNVLYIGVTNSLERRIWEHKHHHLIPGFTAKYNCQFLVYYEMFDRVIDAIAREKQIKGWNRVKKDALVATMNPSWNDLSAVWFKAPPSS